ncbi:DUF551 domain-containing protein [Klebsiella pneumoniae]|uniref:DUF551 domain-containing protein n=1 Tax=Klebsiella pneumoniae TaxID=573 RepID=UPI000E350993|nr:DUF551 domain-containing protein [Klebsiella pneumoniae]
MDSESGCLPLDYLQGHKDGLEWAAQLAEANHPETGDWLYDDPIELAKAIRKGPDMPPAQPVADSEPVAVIDLANLDYLLSGADADVWPPEREEMGDVLLYRHAQPAPVVPVVPVKIPGSVYQVIYQECGGFVDCDANAQTIWSACRAAMLAAATQSPGSDPATVPGKWIPVSEQMPDVGVKVLCFPAKDEPIHATFNGQLWLQDVSWSGSEEPIDNVIPVTVTHWMPLPTGPQEVKDAHH